MIINILQKHSGTNDSQPFIPYHNKAPVPTRFSDWAICWEADSQSHVSNKPFLYVLNSLPKKLGLCGQSRKFHWSKTTTILPHSPAPYQTTNCQIRVSPVWTILPNKQGSTERIIIMNQDVIKFMMLSQPPKSETRENNMPDIIPEKTLTLKVTLICTWTRCFHWNSWENKPCCSEIELTRFSDIVTLSSEFSFLSESKKKMGGGGEEGWEGEEKEEK